MDLPRQFATKYGIHRLSVFYSGTLIGDRPLWRKFQRVVSDTSGDIKFVDEEKESLNVVSVSVEYPKVILSLCEVCTFAIVIDERKMHHQSQKKTFIKALLKLVNGYKSLTADILILVGCDRQAVVSTHGNYSVIVLLLASSSRPGRRKFTAALSKPSKVLAVSTEVTSSFFHSQF
jgi:hypothetical protein